MKANKRNIWIVALAVVIIGSLALAFRPQPVRVDVAEVTRGRLEVSVNEDGKTRIKDRYVVSTPLSGRMQRIHLRAGDPVVAGETVITVLEPTSPELLNPRDLAQAEARTKAADAARMRAVPLMQRAQSDHNYARTELERAQKLFADGTLSQQELDNAEQKERAAAEDLKSAGFALQIADYELEVAKAALVRTQPNADQEDWRLELKSPIDGRVLRVLQESASVVPVGLALVEIGNPSDLEIVIDVLSTDGVKIVPGDRVWLDHWGGEQPLQGRVRLVEPSAFTKISALGVEEQRVNVIADLVDPPSARPNLGDAFRVEARIVIWDDDDALIVPTGALFREGDAWAVFLMQDGRAVLRTIEIGHRNDLQAEVRSGLSDGDRVLLHPSDRVANGVKVEPR